MGSHRSDGFGSGLFHHADIGRERHKPGTVALVFSANMTINPVKYRRLRRKYGLMTVLAYTVPVSVMSGCRIYHLMVSPAHL